MIKFKCCPFHIKERRTTDRRAEGHFCLSHLPVWGRIYVVVKEEAKWGDSEI